MPPISEQIKTAIAELLYKHGHDTDFLSQELYDLLAGCMGGLLESANANLLGLLCMMNNTETYRESISTISNEYQRLTMCNNYIKADLQSGYPSRPLEPVYPPPAAYPAAGIMKQHTAPVYLQPFQLN